MFSFPNMPASCNLQNLLNSELRLCNAVTAHACDVTQKLVDLNMCAIKQTMESWSARTENLGHGETSTIPQWLDNHHVKDDIESATTYGLQMSKILLDLQGEFVKLARQRAADFCQRTAALAESAPDKAGQDNGPTAAFMNNMVEQASKGYAQWTDNMLRAMNSPDHPAGNAGMKKKTSHDVRVAAK